MTVESGASFRMMYVMVMWTVLTAVMRKTVVSIKRTVLERKKITLHHDLV